MAETSGAGDSSLIHLILYSFIQEFVFLHIFPLSLGGWGWSNSPGGPSGRRSLRFYAKLEFPWPALPAADQIMPFPGEELGSTMCGAAFHNNCLLAILTVICCIRQTEIGPGKTRKNGWGCIKLSTIQQQWRAQLGKSFLLVIARFSRAFT